MQSFSDTFSLLQIDTSPPLIIKVEDIKMDVEMNNNKSNIISNNNGLSIDEPTSTTATLSTSLSSVAELNVSKRDLENDDDDEIWEGLASHLLTSDDIVTLDLVSGDDDDLMPPDLMTCEATVESLVRLDPNRFGRQNKIQIATMKVRKFQSKI